MEHDPETRSSWTFWEIDIELPKGNHELAVRASDPPGKRGRRFRTAAGISRAISLSPRTHPRQGRLIS
ncbi:hypothetical protein MPC4_20029 [Methylocella tundrae]|uniref:Uncharacterized protein n=1 Tax=Methylocella tundrae TaxID=227605 RepID=A0A8B6M5Z2_METTU|nr:hypothetical protein MPC1_490008 [Methylocella tundrae]VTZ49819.1 hypothetical protein MPC4_20029 [Methylocella tundrae]